VEESERVAALDSFDAVTFATSDFLHDPNTKLKTATSTVILPAVFKGRNFIESVVCLIHFNAALSGLFYKAKVNATT
jgi:hypothetical protein